MSLIDTLTLLLAKNTTNKQPGLTASKPNFLDGTADYLVSTNTVSFTAADFNFSSNLANAFVTPVNSTGSASPPTEGQFLAAANWVTYFPYFAPPSLSAFMSNGKQMQVLDVANGLFGEAWQTASHQVVIAFSATNPLSPFGYDFYMGQRKSDELFAQGLTGAADQEALNFTRQVEQAAAAQGISPQTGVFTTGESLGGNFAEYVAQQTGLGGIAYISPGLPVSHNAGPGDNFVNILSAGDPISQLDDRFGIDPLAWDHGLEHYGKVIQSGPQWANGVLSGLSNILLATTPAGVNASKYMMDSFLAPSDLVAGDFGDAFANLSPVQLAFAAYSETAHNTAFLLTALTDANLTIPQLVAAPGTI